MELTSQEKQRVVNALNYRKPKVSASKAAFKARLYKEEGKGKPNRDGFSYLDTKNHLTVGVGHKFEKGDRAVFQKLFGKSVDYDAVRKGKVPLNDQQMEKLLNYDVDRKVATSKRLFPKFDQYNPELQGAILDGVYRGDLSGSPKTRRLMNEGKWEAAAKEYLNHEGYRESKKKKSGIYKRMNRNAAIIKKGN